jgi:hypothetical protein
MEHPMVYTLAFLAWLILGAAFASLIGRAIKGN